jgi:DNA-binding response OmpR family regulator
MSDTGRAVDTHIHRLRKKLSQLSGVGIATIRSRGFRLEMSGSAAPQARWRQS